MDTRFKRFLSMAMAILMVVSMMPANIVFAEDLSEETKPDHVCDFLGVMSTVEPTCTEDGVKTLKCEGCGATKTEVIPAPGHTYVDGKCECGEADPNYEASHEHSYQYACSTECSTCENGTREASHTYEDGKCECGAEETPVPTVRPCVEGCWLEEGHEGECEVVCSKDERCVLEDGHDGLCEAFGGVILIDSEDTLVAAIAAGGTVKLLDDILTNKMITVAGKTITLDLNGHTITAGTGVNYVLWIQNNATATIIDSGENGGIVNNSQYGYAILNQGTLTINDGTFIGDYALWNGYDTINSVATINGGTFKFNGNPGAGFSVGNSGTLNVEGGEIKDWVHSFGTMSVEGGDIEYIYVSPSGKELKSVADSKTTITSGSIYSLEVDNGNDTTIKGGSFTEQPDAQYVQTGSAITVNGKTMIKTENGLGEPVAQIGETPYTSLAEAVAAGGEVKLLKDVEITTSIKITNTVTVDLNGKKLTGPDDGKANWYAFIVDGGNLTLKDSDGNGELYAKCYGVETKSGSFTMESGKITATKNKTFGTAIVNYGGTVTVKGGTISGASDAVYTGGYFSDASTTINGGTIDGTVTVEDWEDMSFTETLSVKGGSFTEEPDAQYVQTGLTITVNGETMIKTESGLIKESDIVAQIGETPYTSLAEAVAAGGEVKLLKDVEITTSIKITNTVTVDLNGKKLTGPDDGKANWYAFIVDGGNLTLKDSDGNGELYAKCYGVETKSGSFTMESGKITATKNKTFGTAIVNYGGTVIVKGGTISGASDAVYTGGYFSDASTTINGGTIEGTVTVEDWEDKSFTETVSAEGNVNVQNFVAEAQVGSTFYGSLATAVNAAQAGDTVRVLTEIEVGAVITVTKDLVLDLNGKTLNAEFRLSGAATLTAPAGLNVTTDQPNYVVVYADGKYSIRLDSIRIIDMSAFANDSSKTIKAGAEIYVDGVRHILTDQLTIEISDVLAKKSAMFVTTYEYKGASTGSSSQAAYPTAMYVWLVKGATDPNGDKIFDTFTVERITALDNFFKYEGTSIRVGASKNGIRFFTSVNANDANKLMNGKLITSGSLAGVKMVGAGTWFRKTNEARSEVYGGKAGSTFRVFQKVGDRNWFTGVLTGLETDAKTITDGIDTRPYAELKLSNGSVLTLYGGILNRSIYYVAMQNKDTFTAGSTHDKFVEGLIEKGDSIWGEA